ncbi:unnamed protein product, partial [Ectocarpus sp. 12 AP-2014]
SVVCCVRFSTDGTKIAAGSHSCVKVFDVNTFKQLYVCRKQVLEEQGAPQTADGGDPYVRAVCFSPDGLSIVAGMEKNSAKVLVLEEEGSRQGAITLSGHESEVYSLDWVSDMIASGSGDGRIRLWDSVTGACKASLGDMGGPQDGVTSVVLRQARDRGDTTMVAAASIDRVVHVWSTQTHKILHRLDGHSESVYAITFSADGNRLVSGGLDKTIKASAELELSMMVWDLGPGSEGRLSPQANTLPGGHKDYVLSVCFSQDGKYIISGSKDRSVTMWDARLMKRVATITGFKNSVIGVSASPFNSMFATGSGDNLVCVWNYGDRDDYRRQSGNTAVAPASSGRSSSAEKPRPPSRSSRSASPPIPSASSLRKDDRASSPSPLRASPGRGGRGGDGDGGSSRGRGAVGLVEKGRGGSAGAGATNGKGRTSPSSDEREGRTAAGSEERKRSGSKESSRTGPRGGGGGHDSDRRQQRHESKHRQGRAGSPSDGRRSSSNSKERGSGRGGGVEPMDEDDDTEEEKHGEEAEGAGGKRAGNTNEAPLGRKRGPGGVGNGSSGGKALNRSSSSSSSSSSGGGGGGGRGPSPEKRGKVALPPKKELQRRDSPSSAE